MFFCFCFWENHLTSFLYKKLQNVITFNTILDTISKSKEKGAAARAESLLDRMQQMYLDGCKEVRPDTFSFASVLNAYANSTEPNAAEKCEEILRHMQLLYEDGNKNVRPNTICFSTVIKAYAKSRRPDAAQVSENYKIYTTLGIRN